MRLYMPCGQLARFDAGTSQFLGGRSADKERAGMTIFSYFRDFGDHREAVADPRVNCATVRHASICSCFSERVELLSLELVTLSVSSIEAETVRGVRVTVSGTCQVKVDAFKHEDLEQNLPQITLACQHFLGKVSRITGPLLVAGVKPGAVFRL